MELPEDIDEDAEEGQSRSGSSQVNGEKPKENGDKYVEDESSTAMDVSQ
jgi:hypothetical protein